MLKFYGLIYATDQGLDVEEFRSRHAAEEKMVEVFCEKVKDLFEDDEEVDEILAELIETVKNADRSKESLLEGVNISDDYFGMNQHTAWVDDTGSGYDWEIRELAYPEKEDTSERIRMQWLTDINEHKGYAENVHLWIYPTLREYSLCVLPYIDGEGCVNVKNKSDIYALAASLKALGYEKREEKNYE